MAENSIQAEDSHYRDIVEYAGDIIYRADRSGRFTFCNGMALSLLGYSKSEVIGRSYLDFMHPRFRGAAVRFYGRQFVRRDRHSYYEFVCLARDGGEFWVGQNVQVLEENGEICGFQAIARDITDRKKLEEKLAFEASHDALTGLPNRRYLMEQLHGLLNDAGRVPGSPLSICICDVDRFKQINDCYGHAKGDEVLKAVGSSLRQNVRRTDIVGRMAGDEFAVFLPGISAEEAVLCIDRVRERLETWVFVAGDQVCGITASFGVAHATPGTSVKDLLAAADLALYAAKNAGRNCTAVPSSILGPKGVTLAPIATGSGTHQLRRAVK